MRGFVFVICLGFCFARVVLAEPWDFFVDIDDVLVASSAEQPKEAQGPGIFTREDGKKVRFVPYGAEFLAGLAAINGGRVHIFTTRPEGGQDELKNLRLADGRSALDIVKASGGSVFTFKNVKDASRFPQYQPRGYSFSGSYKKVLSSVLPPGQVLERAFLFDDNMATVAAGEEKQHVHIPYSGGTPEQLLEVGVEPGEKRRLKEYLQTENRLVRALGLIRYAIREGEKTKVPPGNILHDLQFQTDGQWTRDRELDVAQNAKIFRLGIEAIRAQNPDAHLIRIPPSCRAAYRALD